jgi:hypothetical protein
MGISITVKPRTFQIKFWQGRFIAVREFSNTKAYKYSERPFENVEAYSLYR